MNKYAFTVGEAVELSGLGRTSLYAAISSGELPARKRGRRTVVLARDLEHYLESLPKLRVSLVAQSPRDPK